VADNYEVASAFVRLRPKVDPNFAREGERQIGSPLKKIAEGAALAFGAIKVAGIFRDAIGEQREAQRVGRQTEAVLRSTGGVAGVTATDIGKLADKLSKVAAVDDEVIQQGENVLLTFRDVRNEAGKGNDVFNRATRAALDLSAAFGTDLQGSIIQIGKALNDPIQGLTALRRVGVSFTEQQQAQIKALAESGNLLKAQKIILGELETEFGGAAAAAADPIARFHVATKNLEESLGVALTPALNVASKGVTSLSDAFLALPRPVQSTAAILGTAAVAAVGATIAYNSLAAALEGTAIAAAATEIGAIGLAAVPVIGPLAAVAAAVYEIGYAGDNVSGKIGKTLTNVSAAIAAGNGQITATAQSAVAAFLQLTEGTEAFRESGKTVKDFIPVALEGDKAVRAFVKSMGLGPTGAKTLTKDLLTLAHAIQGGSAQGKALSEILGDVTSGEDDAAAAAKRFADAMDSTIGHFVDVQSAALGVRSAEDTLTEAVKGTGDQAAASSSKMKTYADAVTQVFDSVVDTERAHISAREAMARLMEVASSNTKGAAAAARGLVRLDGQQASSADDVSSALLDVIDARKQEVEAEAASGEIADTTQARHQALIDSLLDLRNQYPGLAGDIDKYIDAAKKIPELPLEDVAKRTADKQQNLADATLNVVTALQRQASADDDPIHGLLIMDQTLGSLLDKYKRFPEAAGVLSGAIASVDAALAKDAALLGISVGTLEQLLSSGISGNLLSALADPKTGGDVARLIATPRAGGGPVKAGVPYWVGEKRPELFVPHESGTIVANPAQAPVAGATLNIVNNITAPDPVRAGHSTNQALRDAAYLLGI
jgi:3D (Asp-Asp-Asp) domain-containing protein